MPWYKDAVGSREKPGLSRMMEAYLGFFLHRLAASFAARAFSLRDEKAKLENYEPLPPRDIDGVAGEGGR